MSEETKTATTTSIVPTSVELNPRDTTTGKFMSAKSPKAKERRREVREKVLGSVQDWADSTGDQTEIKSTDNQIIRQIKILAKTVEEETSGKNLMAAAKAAEYIAKLVGLFEDEKDESDNGPVLTVKFDYKDFYPEGVPPIKTEPKAIKSNAQPTWVEGRGNPDPTAEYVVEGN